MHIVTTLYAPDGVCNTMELDGEGAYGDLFPLMQFTGLHDKNGKEIYEGDIVKIVGRIKEPQIVGWDVEQGRFCFVYETGEPMRDFHIRTEVPRFEIIGNIYENPELLS